MIRKAVDYFNSLAYFLIDWLLSEDDVKLRANRHVFCIDLMMVPKLI